MKKYFIVIFFLALFLIGVVAGQMYSELKAGFINAAYSTSKPANGHSWSEMECTTGLCVTSENKVGIGTDSPSKKLEVNGDILASGTGDVCNGSGKCLSSVAQTNVLAGASNPTCPTGQTIIMKGYNGAWYMGTNTSITSWSQVVCGLTVTADGTPLLVNGVHTNQGCTTAGGTVVGDGSGNNMCRFNNSSCPSGWTQYLNWSATTGAGPAPASGVNSCGGSSVGPCQGNAYTGSHTWANIATEQAYNASVCDGNISQGVMNCYCTWSSVTWGGYGCNQTGPSYLLVWSSPAVATVTQIGCY